MQGSVTSAMGTYSKIKQDNKGLAGILPTISVDVLPGCTLHHSLSFRQAQMIAIRGTIGTGLFLCTGRSLAQGGPATMLICYSIIGFIIYITLLLCYSSFDLSSIYTVKYHLTTRIRLYQLSFLISTIPGPHSRFPALSDLPVI